MNINKTTISISKELLQKLKLIKLTKRESYEEVVTRLIEKRIQGEMMVIKCKQCEKEFKTRKELKQHLDDSEAY